MPDASDDRLAGLIQQYGRLIGSIIRRVGGRAVSDLREDIQQEVALSLWKQVKADREIANPYAYVYSVAARETVRAVRSELARRARAAEEGLASGPGNPLRVIEDQERAKQLETCLAGLEPRRAQAVRAHLAGFDVQEIMKAYAWPYQTARNLIARGLSDLREALREAGIDG